MTPEDLKDLLHRWGRAYGERLPTEAELSGGWATGTHALARAGSTLSNYGSRRRRRRSFVAADGQVRDEAAPVMVCFGRESRSANMASAPEDPELAAVEAEALALYQANRLRGVVLRIHFCTRASAEDKVKRVREAVGHPVKASTYRYELAHAITWMDSRLSRHPAARSGVRVASAL